MEEVTTFWSDIWSRPEPVTEVPWLRKESLELHPEANHLKKNISSKNVSDALAKTQKWKPPGVDQVTNFWLFQLKCSHLYLATALNNAIEQPETVPKRLTPICHELQTNYVSLYYV